MKKSLVEWLLGLALVAAWVVVAAQAERSQRVGSGPVAELEGTRLAAVDVGETLLALLARQPGESASEATPCGFNSSATPNDRRTIAAFARS